MAHLWRRNSTLANQVLHGLNVSTIQSPIRALRLDRQKDESICPSELQPSQSFREVLAHDHTVRPGSLPGTR